jgi:hypothetical protein
MIKLYFLTYSRGQTKVAKIELSKPGLQPGDYK